MFISKAHQVIHFNGKCHTARFSFFFAVAIFCLFPYNCDNPANHGIVTGRFTFCIVDVGQGLAQFGVMDGRAVVWDMGPPNQYTAWRASYTALGSPRIETIIISHTDLDHYGGLQYLDANINWTGTIITTPYEDTAKIRASTADIWRERIRFIMFIGGDTLKTFNSVEIVCLWPPEHIEPETPLATSALRNRYSMVFSIRHGHNRALITSDIDDIAMNAIAVQSNYNLRAQILSVPHHGSSSSINRLFFSYVSAETAIISCARQNSYGHPSRAAIDEYTYRGVRLLYTYLDNTVTFVSNGYYWKCP